MATYTDDSSHDSSSDDSDPLSDSNSTISASQIFPTLPNRLTKIGDYELHRIIGRGGMGIVYEALDTTLERQVALKILPQAAHLDPLRAKRFRNESRVAAQLSHPNIIPVFAVGEADGVSYFAMHLVDGRNLSQLIKAIRQEMNQFDSNARQELLRPGSTAPATSDQDRTTPDGDAGRDKRQPVPHADSPTKARFELSASDFGKRSGRYQSTQRVANTVARIGACVAEALQHAHDIGIVHRDIKPSNLMLDQHGKIWVTDFGLAHIMNAPSLTRTGDVLGTFRYMSPEQATGVKALIDHRTDIYSLGITLSELLVLRPLVQGSSTKEILQQVIYGPPFKLRSIDPGIPEDLAVILEKSMSKNPLERYTTAGELADDLNRFVRHEAIRAKRPGLLRRCQHWVERHKAAAMASSVAFFAVFLVTLIAAGMILAAWQGEREQLIRTRQALSVSEALRILSVAAMELAGDPGNSLRLGIAGAEAAPGEEANRVLLAACDAITEYATVTPRNQVSGQLACSPDGKFVVSCAGPGVRDRSSFAAIVHSTIDGRTVKRLDSNLSITSAAFSPSGKYLLTVADKSESGQPDRFEAKTWSTSDWAPRKSLGNVGRSVASPVAVHPTHDQFLMCRENEVFIFDAVTEREVVVLRGHTAPILHAEFSPSGQFVVTVSDDGTVRTWNCEQGNQLGKEIHWHRVGRNSATARFTLSSDAILVFDGLRVARYPLLNDGLSSSVERSLRAPNLTTSRVRDQFVVVEGQQATVRSSKTFEIIRVLRCESKISSASFHQSANELLVNLENNMHRYDLSTGALLSRHYGHKLRISHAIVAGNNQVLASVSDDGTMRLWKTSTDSERRSFTLNHQETFAANNKTSFQISLDDQLISTTSLREHNTTLLRKDGVILPGSYKGIASGELFESERLLLVGRQTAAIIQPSTSRELSRWSFSDELSATNTQLVDDGKKLFAHTKNGSAMLVDLSTGVISRPGMMDEAVSTVSFARAANLGLIVNTNGSYSAIDTSTGNVLWTRHHALPIVDIQLSDDANRLAFVDTEGEIECWRVASHELIAKISPTQPPADRIALTFNAEHVVVWRASNNQEIRCYPLQSPEAYSKVEVAGDVEVQIHPSAPLVAVASRSGAFLWNIHEPTQLQLSDRSCQSVCFAQDRIALLLRRTMQEPAIELRALNGELHFKQELKLSPYSIHADKAGDHLAVTEYGYSVNVHNFDTGEQQYASVPHPNPIVWAGFLGKTSQLVTASADGTLHVSDQRNGLTNRFLSKAPITSVAMNQGGDSMFVGHQDGTIRLWAPRDEAQTKSFDAHQGPVVALGVNQAGTLAISLAKGERARLWNVAKQESVTIDLDNVIQVDLSPSGDHCLVVTRGDPITKNLLWQVDTKSREIVKIADQVKYARYSPEGLHIGIIETSGQVALQRASDQSLVLSVQASSEQPSQLAFSPTGQQLAIANSTDCEIWNIADQTKHMTVKHMQGPVDAHIPWQPFSHDGEWFVSADPIVTKCPIHLLDHSRKIAPRQLTVEESAKNGGDTDNLPGE